MVAIDKYDTDPCDDISVKDWKVDEATFAAMRLCLPHARDATHLCLRHADLTMPMVQQLAVALSGPDCTVKHVSLDFNPLYHPQPPPLALPVEEAATAEGGSPSTEAAASGAADAPVEAAAGEGKHAEEAAASLQQESKGGEGGLHEGKDGGADESEAALPQRIDPAQAAAAFALLLHPEVGLRSLSLRGCGLAGAEAAMPLAAALSLNTSLETLILSDNALGDEGLSLLAHAVRDTAAPLCELDVGGAAAGAEGALAVAAAAAPWALTEQELEQRDAVFQAREGADAAWQAALEAHAPQGGDKKGGKGGRSKSLSKTADKKKGKSGATDGPPALVPWFVRDLESLSAAHRSAVDVAVRYLAETGAMPVPSADSLPPSMQEGGGSKSLKGGKGGKGGKSAPDTAVTDDTPGVKLWLTQAKPTLRALNISRNALGARGLSALRATLVPDQLLSLLSSYPPRPSSAAGSEANEPSGQQGEARSGRRGSSPKAGAKRGSSPRGGRASPRVPDEVPPGTLAARTVSGVQVVWAQSVLGRDNHLYSVFVPEGMQGGYLASSDVKAWWGGHAESKLEDAAGLVTATPVSHKLKLAGQDALYTPDTLADMNVQVEKARSGGLTLLL